MHWQCIPRQEPACTTTGPTGSGGTTTVPDCSVNTLPHLLTRRGPYLGRVYMCSSLSKRNCSHSACNTAAAPATPRGLPGLLPTSSGLGIDSQVGRSCRPSTSSGAMSSPWMCCSCCSGRLFRSCCRGSGRLSRSLRAAASPVSRLAWHTCRPHNTRMGTCRRSKVRSKP